MASTVQAQWPNVTDFTIPRLADGRPNLAAPAPRLPNGRPDLSGVWVMRATQDPGFLGLPFGPEFMNIGAGIDGGLPYRPWAAAHVAETRANDRIRDPLTHCLPIGPVRMHTITFYREIVQLPEKIILLNEYNTTYRQIFLDGRPLPENPVPTLNGYSTARWEKTVTLVQHLAPDLELAEAVCAEEALTSLVPAAPD